MHAVVDSDYRRLAELTERSLRALGFEFLKNSGGEMTEFEVKSPCRCLVTVQNATRPRLSIFVGRGNKVESLIQVKRVVGAEARPDELRAAAGSIVAAMRGTIPEKKWKGLDELG